MGIKDHSFISYCHKDADLGYWVHCVAVNTGDDMEHLGKTSVVFDYTSFLGASCTKKWTFLEAMSTFAPIFSLAWKNTIKESITVEDRLWQQAMNSLSANRSDESNILTLLELAKFEGVEELKLVMPYELEDEQIERMRRKSGVSILALTQDELMIRF
ncbi:hypothetical protein ViNHUV68_16670 [Vibrio sp. NH-UV-68]